MLRESVTARLIAGCVTRNEWLVLPWSSSLVEPRGRRAHCLLQLADLPLDELDVVAVAVFSASSGAAALIRCRRWRRLAVLVAASSASSREGCSKA